MRGIVLGLDERDKEAIGGFIIQLGEGIARGALRVGEAQELLAAAMDGMLLGRGQRLTGPDLPHRGIEHRTIVVGLGDRYHINEGNISAGASLQRPSRGRTRQRSQASPRRADGGLLDRQHVRYDAHDAIPRASQLRALEATDGAD